jgi:hypothetical protein
VAFHGSSGLVKSLQCNKVSIVFMHLFPEYFDILYGKCEALTCGDIFGFLKIKEENKII